VIAGGTAHAAATNPSPSCAASYQTVNEAQAGFVSQVSVTNTGSSAVNGWSVTFTFGGHQVVTASWNATVQQSGAVLTAVNASWDGTIPVGGSIYGFGLYGTWWGSDAPPLSLTYGELRYQRAGLRRGYVDRDPVPCDSNFRTWRRREWSVAVLLPAFDQVEGFESGPVVDAEGGLVDRLAFLRGEE
jgi:hypothetical protein